MKLKRWLTFVATLLTYLIWTAKVSPILWRHGSSLALVALAFGAVIGMGAVAFFFVRAIIGD